MASLFRNALIVLIQMIGSCRRHFFIVQMFLRLLLFKTNNHLMMTDNLKGGLIPKDLLSSNKTFLFIFGGC